VIEIIFRESFKNYYYNWIVFAESALKRLPVPRS